MLGTVANFWGAGEGNATEGDGVSSDTSYA